MCALCTKRSIFFLNIFNTDSFKFTLNINIIKRFISRIYFESWGAEHPTAVSRTVAGLIAVDDILAGRPGARHLGADFVDAPTASAVRLALYPFELAGHVVASWHELQGTSGPESPRPPHSRQCQLFASGQLTCDAAEAARGFTAAFFRYALALVVIIAGRRSRWAHILFVEGRASTGGSQQRLCKSCDSQIWI